MRGLLSPTNKTSSVSPRLHTWYRLTYRLGTAWFLVTNNRHEHWTTSAGKGISWGIKLGRQEVRTRIVKVTTQPSSLIRVMLCLRCWTPATGTQRNLSLSCAFIHITPSRFKVLGYRSSYCPSLEHIPYPTLWNMGRGNICLLSFSERGSEVKLPFLGKTVTVSHPQHSGFSSLLENKWSWKSIIFSTSGGPKASVLRDQSPRWFCGNADAGDVCVWRAHKVLAILSLFPATTLFFLDDWVQSPYYNTDCLPDSVITESLMATPLYRMVSTSEYMRRPKNATGIIHYCVSFTIKPVTCSEANVNWATVSVEITFRKPTDATTGKNSIDKGEKKSKFKIRVYLMNRDCIPL